MQFSTQTLDLFYEIKTFSKNKIKNEEDLCFLIEISFRNSPKQARLRRADPLLSEITFIAKYLNGLAKILQSRQISGLRSSDVQQVKPEETLLKIKGEYTDHLKKLLTLLEKYISGTDLEPADKFKKNYLAMTQQSLRNLNTLIYDLTWVKNYFNVRRQK